MHEPEVGMRTKSEKLGNAEPRQKQAAVAFAIVVLAFCSSDLIGWWFHIPLLTTVIPNYATMKPNTALCLALTALGLLGRIRWAAAKIRRIGRLGADALALLVSLVSGASLAEYVTGRSFGIDQVLATVPMERFGDPAGRMAIGTAVCLLITSAGLFLMDRLPRASVALILAGAAASISGLIGFVLQAGPLARVLWFKSLAIHTAIGLLLVQLAALAVRSEREPFCSLDQQWRGEEKRRYLLFAVMLLPILLALPTAAGMHAGYYDAPFALSLLVVLLFCLQTCILWSDNKALARVESRLRESEAESSRVLHSIGDAVIVTDSAARVLRMNPVAQELTGWTAEAALHKPLEEVFPIFSEATGEPAENPVDKIKRFGTIVGLANHTVLRHREGHRTHIDDSSAPIRDEEGQLVGIVLVFRNVNQRKEAEALLRNSDDKLRLALDAAKLGAWEIDLASGRLEATPLCKANFGRGPDDPFSYEDFLASIHPDDRPQVEEAVRLAVAERKVYRAEYRVAWPDDSEHWVVASGQLMCDEAGMALRLVGVTLDATARHQSAAALIQSEKLAAVGRLASSIAHEINNPLESVTNLFYLANRSDSLEEVREYLGTAEHELQRVSAIANQTLRFHKQATNPKPVTCEELVSGVLSIYQGKLINSRVQLEQRKRATQAVLCFEGEIRQVLSNLVGNAIDAMPVGGRLLLRSREATDWITERKGLVITVADTGSGMSLKTSLKLFEPFYTTKGLSGTGLGLWISQEIINRHEGSIRLRSRESVGSSGTVFVLFLPFDATIR